MHTKILVSKDKTQAEIRAFVLASHHRRSTILGRPRQTSERKEAVYGTKSYNDALQRAFNRAKTQIYFNPDMRYFVTLTYEGLQTDIDRVMHDIKMLVKAEKRKGHTNLKYIYVLEWQKRGSLHVHMITNNELTTHTNQNGYKSLTYWKHGYTSMLSIKDFDNNFKPYLYLFKYMRKAERIGKTFVHSSRNLNNFEDISDTGINLSHFTVVNQERTYTKLPTGDRRTLNFYKYYLSYANMEERKAYLNELEGYNLWKKLLFQSTKEPVKSPASHLLH